MNQAEFRLDDQSEISEQAAGRRSLRRALNASGRIAGLGRRYLLTPAELGIAALVAEARPLKEVALTLGISINTVRAHLRSIFDKTGVKRQAELVRLVLIDG